MFKRSTMTKAAAVITLAGGLVALAGSYDSSWRTIDSGGAMRTTGGDFGLSGTIGQSDVGAMTGGSFALVGGFWALPSGSAGGCVRDPTWICDGDVDGDGQVNPVDSGLIQAAFGSTDEGNLCQYDVDCDGQINPVDSGIVQSLFGSCEAPRAVCP